MANVITVAVTESNVTVTETPLNVNVSTTDDTITVTQANSIITVSDSVSNITVSNTTFNTITSNTDLSIANLSVSGNVDVGGNSELSGNVRVGSNADVNTMITNVDVQTGKIVMERDIPYTEFNSARARQIDIQTVDYNAASNVYTTTGLNQTGLRIVGPAGANSAYDGMQIPAISFNYGDTISSSGGYNAANPFNIAFEYNGAGATAGNLLLSSGGGTGMAGNESRVKINTFTDIDGVLTLANGLVVGKNGTDPEVTHSLDMLVGNDIGFLGSPDSARGNIEGVNNINAVGNITTLGTFVGDGSGLTGLPSNAQAKAYIEANGLDMSNTITSDSNISTTGVVSFGNSATQTHTFTGNLDVTGNIEVSGNLNYRNVEDLYVRDQSITLNANAASDATVSIIANRPVAGANTVLRWNETSDIWEFTNDGSTYYPIPTSTSDLAEGTNLYFTNARANTVSRAAISVTTASPSGNGSLSYSNTTGVFTFTPANVSGGGGGGNYGDSNVISLLGSYTNTIQWTTDSFTQATRLSHANSGTSKNAASNEWWRYGNTQASPTAVSSGMLVSNQRYYGYDGTNAINQTAPNGLYNVFVDGTVSANTVPLSHEFITHPEARAFDVSLKERSVLSIASNGAVYFNRVGSQGSYDTTAKANIDPDGNFSTNASITAVGNITTTANISGGYILGNGSQLSGITSGIALTDLSVTQASASGTGTLEYSNVSGVFTYTPPDLSSFSTLTNAQAQAFIQSSGLTMTADITSDSLISTTGNVQFNADTDVSGLSGLTFDSSTNNLGLGTPTPKAALHIRGTSNESQIYMTEYNGTSSAGIDLRTFRAGGTESVPTVTPKSDRIWERIHNTYDGVGTVGDGISTGFQNAFVEQIITDPVVDHTANTVPVFHQFYTYLDGDATTTPHALMRMRSNGDIQFNAGSAFSYTGAANTVIANDGTITTAGNITTTANISGNYILGDGSQLSNLPSGVSNAQAQAYIQENGLTMTSVISSNSNITTTANINAAGGTLTGVLTSNSNIELTDAFFVGDLDGAVVTDVRNETGSTLNKGSAVYLTGSATGDTPHVALADNSNASLMPAMGIVYENIANASVGQVATSGVINNTSHGFTQGADLFVSTGGALIETAPTGESAGIQKIGKVVSANHILVSGASRVNATPNLDANNIFIGNSTNQASTVNLNALSSSIITDKRLEGDRFAGGNVTLPISQYLTSGFVYFKFDNAVDPFLPNGTKVFFQDTDANNPLSNGSITSDNIFYTRKSSSYSYYLLYSDEACQNLVSTSVPTTSPTNANVTFGSVIATGPLTMSAGTGAELVNGSNAYSKDYYIRNTLTLGETGLRDAVLDVSGDATITNYSGNAALTLVNNRNDSAIPTQLVMKQNKNAGGAAGVAGDALSVLKTQGMTSSTGTGLITYANVLAKITDPTDGAEDGEIDFRLVKAGTETSTMLLKSTEMELNVPLVTELTSNANININTRVDSVPSNVTANVQDVQAYNNGTLTEDSIAFTGGQIFTDGMAVTYSGATDGDITPLNGRVYYIKWNSGDGGRYELFDDSGFTTGSRRVTNGVFRSSGVGQIEYVSSTNVAAGGNLNIGGSNAVIQSLGGNITSTGNISGSYILGDGSQLTNLPTGGDSFGTITVAGQTNIQATQSNAILDIASSGAITLSTSGNTLTIGGSGGTYGNSDVETFLGSDTMTGDIKYQGNLDLSSANVTTAITEYQGNVTSGVAGDRILVASDPGWFSGQFVTFSGTTNANLTFLNNNVYQVQRVAGTTYDLYTNFGTFTRLNTAIGTENPTNGLETTTRTSDNTSATIHGNLFVTANNALHTNEIKPFTSGGTFSMTGLRASDVGLGQNGNDFFFPETGGNTEGGLLVTDTTGAGAWQQGYVATFENKSGPEIIKITSSRNTSLAIEEIYKRARGTTASPTVLSANDRIHEIEYYGHDGTDYEEAIGEHVYVDTNSGTIGTGVMPLSKEFYVRPEGIMANSRKSVLKIRSNRAIEFNADEERSFNSSTGNANVTQDGSINSVSTITGLNIKSDQFVQLKNYTTTEINALSGMVAGDTVFNTTESTICFYTGSAWNKVTSTAL